MRVLVVSDSDRWAFARRAEAYAAYPPPGWDVQVAYPSRSRHDEDWAAVFLLDCHGSPTAYGDVRFARLMASHAWLHDFTSSDWRTRGCNESRCRSKRDKVFGRAMAVAVYNRTQLVECASMRNRLVLAPYCPDLAVFSPQNRPVGGGKLRVGWCYQPNGGLNSFKGISDVLVPVIAAVGDRVEWDVRTPDAACGMGTYPMVAYYRSLDVFLCTSSGEGGPQGPFEAAACGCAVVSTDVGQVSDWDALRNLELIVPTYRNAEEARETVLLMSSLILSLANERDRLEAARERLLADVEENWNAEKACPAQLQEIFRQ